MLDGLVVLPRGGQVASFAFPPVGVVVRTAEGVIDWPGSPILSVRRLCALVPLGGRGAELAQPRTPTLTLSSPLTAPANVVQSFECRTALVGSLAKR